MSMKAVAARSALWSAAETWGVRGVSALVFLLLARLLDADAFGVMALAGVYLMILQMLADQGMRRRVFREIPEKRVLRAHDLWIRPIIADAIAQAVLQVEVEGRAAGVIVLFPIPRLRLDALKYDVAEARKVRRLNPFAFNGVEPPERPGRMSSSQGTQVVFTNRLTVLAPSSLTRLDIKVCRLCNVTHEA